ncbi:molybdopterin molybdotransferase MoeA [Corynebacterium stationis]|uniref:molybdopterin molybdotransferase MoeA n=1 Tax=Corynebacterium stationis TaxID=1705 RepID=UPI00273AA7B7|nr:molybdopterin molybdotransferase MoeA [Corynebacterium stationis]WLP87660.1 molybdopterin molybdotransferase MoeA [Corynebacterium stationis]
MTSPGSHLKRIRQLVAAHCERRTEQIPIEKSLGRTTSADIIAGFDSPRFDNSQMDGYAVPAADGGRFEVAATIPAGASPQPLAGKAAPIMTGAAVPADAAAIIPVEKATPAEFLESGETISLPATEPGQFIRVQGCDVAAGSTIIPAGTSISAAAVATMASQSILEVEVFSPARMLICSGGAEIQAAEVATSDDSATIPDANAPMLRAMAYAAGIEVVGHVATNDDPAALKTALTDAIENLQPDVVVSSGGISAGKFEVVRQVLESSDSGANASAAAWFGHVDQQPGGPQGCAVFNGVPVICLPGNPVSTLVSFRLFVAPVLGHVPPGSWAQLAEATTGIAGRDQFRRGRVEFCSDGSTVAHIIGGSGSHLITQAVEATHLIRIPAGALLGIGSAVQVYPL